MCVDRQTDVGHINLIARLVTRNPPKNVIPGNFIGYVDSGAEK